MPGLPRSSGPTPLTLTGAAERKAAATSAVRRGLVLTVLLVLVLLGGAGLLWWQGEQSRQALQRETELRAEQRALQLASVLSAQVQLLFTSLDVVLLQLRREWHDDAADFEATARGLTAALPSGAVSHVTIVDAEGMSGYNTLGTAARVSVADREHFRAQRDHDGDRMHVGRAIKSRLARDTWTLIVNRPLRRDGRFAGTISLSVPTAYIGQQLETLSLGRGSVVAVLHADGSFIARSVEQAEAMGRSVAAERPFMVDRNLA